MIYYDNAATTKPDKCAIEKASVFNEEMFFNPSALYRGGLSAQKELKIARDSILKNLCAVNCEVIFTSCGSESDDTAVFGCAKRGTAVTDKGEHAAIYKCFLELNKRGVKTEFIDLNKDGSVDTEKLFAFVKTFKPEFVSIMHVNNETGAINDVNKISEKIKEISPSTVFHVDGVQSYGKIPFKMSSKIDLYSISSHKINGLKGTGALIKRKNLFLPPYIFGGGQESGYRSGTENVFGIKVFQYVGESHYLKLKENYDKVKSIKNTLLNGIDKSLFGVISGENSSPYILSLYAENLRGETIMHALEEKDLIIGNGSACSSKNRYSRVIEACGYGKNVLDGVIRLSFSSENTIEEAFDAVKILNETVYDLKRMME